nr:DUF748 domain-containing protein [Rhodocyclus purpureus]
MNVASRFDAWLLAPGTRWLARIAFIVILVIGVLGSFVLPPIVKSVLIEQASTALHRPVSVDGISINPFGLSLRINGLVIGERELEEAAPATPGPLLAFDSLFVDVSSSSLFRRAPIIEELRLDGLALHLRRLAAQRYNVSDLIEQFLSGPSGPTPAFSVANIQVNGGLIEFDDRVTDEVHRVSDITLHLPVVSSLPELVDSFVDPAFSARIDGSPLALDGRSKLLAKSRESELSLDFSRLDLTRYIDYVPVALPLQLRSALLDGELKVSFRLANDAPPLLKVSGNAALADLRIEDPDGAPLFLATRIELGVGAFDPVQRELQVDRLVLTAPQVFAHARADGSLNWLAVLERGVQPAARPPAGSSAPAAPQPEAAAKVTTPFAWSLATASLSDASIHWRDETRGRPLQLDLLGLDLQLSGLASEAGKPARFAGGGRIEGDERLSLGAFAIKDGELDLAGRRLGLGELRLTDLQALVRRASDGKLDAVLPPLLRQSAKAAAPAARAKAPASAPWQLVAQRVQGEKIDLRFEDAAVQPAATQTIAGLGFVVENFSTAPGASAKLQANFRLNQKGEVGVAGNLALAPLATQLDLDLKGIELLPLQPYFSEKLNLELTRGQATVKGTLKLRQTDTAPAAKRQPLVAGLAGGFSGQATIGDFFAIDKINAADFLRWKSFYFGDVDFRLGPDSLSIGEIALSDFFARVIVSKEGKLNLAEIVRREPAGKQGGAAAAAASVPAAPAAASPAPAAAEPEASRSEGKASVPLPGTPAPEAAEPMPIRIGKVTLQGGRINFTDNFVKPNYTASLREVGGRISGLSSEAGSMADLDLRGSYDRVAPLTIKARLNPLAKDIFLDLDAEVKGVELTSFSPYSGKYAGYEIDKGKLSLAVKYHIEKRLLTAENRLFLDQLTFGDPVESPSATKLPVTLAVALLKNRRGEIDLNLPISGSLDDPEFSIGGLVIKVILNLFAKVLTSPFALLGSLFGGEELSNVDFAYGVATLDAAAQKRLDNLAAALNDRPALQLEITGSVAVERDREGLKLALIERKMRRLKRDDLVNKGVESGSLEQIEITAAERTALLERVYRAEKFPKPRNMIGLLKSLPPEEMEKLIVTNTVISDDDLHELGDRRAERVRDYLVEKAGAPAERIFLLQPKLIQEEGASDAAAAARANRVDFSLR